MFELLKQIFPIPVERKYAKARLLEITLHVGSANAMDFARIKLFLDGGGVGTPRVNVRAMSGPVLQDHGDRGRTAAILGLFYVRHVQPDSGFFLGLRSSRRPQEKKQEQTESDPVHARRESLPIVRTSVARPPKQ